MLWFKKKETEKEIPKLVEHHKQAIEIVAHQEATAEAKKEVDEANERIRSLVQKNHFVVKIYLANGKQLKQKGVV